MFLFSESSARAVVAVVPGSEADFSALCSRHGVPGLTLGTVGGDNLDVQGCFGVPLAELAAARQAVLPPLFS